MQTGAAPNLSQAELCAAQALAGTTFDDPYRGPYLLGSDAANCTKAAAPLAVETTLPLPVVPLVPPVVAAQGPSLPASPGGDARALHCFPLLLVQRLDDGWQVLRSCSSPSCAIPSLLLPRAEVTVGAPPISILAQAPALVPTLPPVDVPTLPPVVVPTLPSVGVPNLPPLDTRAPVSTAPAVQVQVQVRQQKACTCRPPVPVTHRHWQAHSEVYIWCWLPSHLQPTACCPALPCRPHQPRQSTPSRRRWLTTMSSSWPACWAASSYCPS
jgi:hypothetical protein